MCLKRVPGEELIHTGHCFTVFSGWRKVFEEGTRGRVDSMLYNGDGKNQFTFR